MTVAAVPRPSAATDRLARAARAAAGVLVGVGVYLACAPWLPSVEAWLAGHLVAALPGVGGLALGGPRFVLLRHDGTAADLLVTTSCSWSGGLAVLAGVSVGWSHDVRAGVRAWAIPSIVFGAANLLRIVAVAVVLVVWRGDHLWTVHSVVGSAFTGLCGVVAVAWCLRLGREGRECPGAPGVR